VTEKLSSSASSLDKTNVHDFIALLTFSRPIKAYLDQPDISEISVNCPGEVWIEKGHDRTRYLVPELTYDHLITFANLVADFSDQYISPENPILSATMPGGYRIQFVIPPACSKGHVVLSIRKKTVTKFYLEDYKKAGFFDEVSVASLGQVKRSDPLVPLLESKNYMEFLRQAVIARKNIVISGQTSSGKTTFASALLEVIPDNERVITIEDADELDPPQANNVRLFFSRGGQGISKHSAEDLLRSCLRLRPDRIVFGELRGEEAADFVDSINTAHPGSITTIHANGTKLAINRIFDMMNNDMKFEQFKNYITSVIEVFVHIVSTPAGRRIGEIYYSGYGESQDVSRN